MTLSPPQCSAFRYLGYDIDAARGIVTASYGLDEQFVFQEQITVSGGYDWEAPAVAEAARIYFLLAGVSYYKAAAPEVIDLGSTAVRPGEIDFLRSFYVDGLGEFAYRNALDLGDLQIVGGVAAADPVPYAPVAGRPVVPFGGGIDSIVTVERVRQSHPDAALFVLSRAGDRFAAIEGTLGEVGLPVLRAERQLDEQILQSRRLGFYNGHVPVTGIVSSVAVLVAVLARRDAVVMSNEWSASIGNLEAFGRVVNHQYSKSLDFETAFRGVLAGALSIPPEYFSFLRPYSELWVAEQFSQFDRYHRTFRSCNRAFHLDPTRRLDHWCGVCDKCCFIDLILSPFMRTADLAVVFDGNEPLADPERVDQFYALTGSSDAAKPFECVGEVGECQVAAVLAADRPDRADTPLLREVADRVRAGVPAEPGRLLRPLGPSHIPAAYAPKDLLV